MTSSLTGATGAQSGMNATGFKKQKAPSGYSKFQQFTPEQMQLFQNQFSNVSPDSYLSKLAGGDEGLFEQIEAPAWKQFQQATSQNATQFSGAGGDRQSSARGGTGFQNYQNQQTSDFAQGLQSKRMDYMRNALQDLMGYSNQLLGQQPYGFMEKPQSFLQSLAPGIGQGIGAGIGAGVGSAFGPIGTAAGGALGNAAGGWLSKLFGGK